MIAKKVEKKDKVEEGNLEKEEKKAEKTEEGQKKREIVIPGEIIVEGEEYLPGDWTRKLGKSILARRFGLADISGRLVKVIPLSGIYMPRRGNVVIGKIEDLTFNGWIIDINAPYQSFLPVAECPKFINKNDLAEHYDIGEVLSCKVSSVKRKGVDLTIKGRGLGKLEEGIIIHINSNKVPRIIGKEGSMINLIKKESDCDIIVGQNGLIWIKGNKVEDELLAKEAIMFVAEKSFISGLTEQIQEWFNKKKKEKK